MRRPTTVPEWIFFTAAYAAWAANRIKDNLIVSPLFYEYIEETADALAFAKGWHGGNRHGPQDMWNAGQFARALFETQLNANVGSVLARL